MGLCKYIKNGICKIEWRMDGRNEGLAGGWLANSVLVLLFWPASQLGHYALWRLSRKH